MQTAVEQLMIALYEKGHLTENGGELGSLLKKYKEIEKQQIIDAFEEGQEQVINLEGNWYYKQKYE